MRKLARFDLSDLANTKLIRTPRPLYFGDTAHNPETNPRVRLRPSVGEAGGGAVAGGGGGGVSSPPNRQRRPPLLAHHQSVPPLTPPLHTRATGGSSSRLSTSECSSLDVAVGGGVGGVGGGGGGEWRRASDGGGGAGGGGGEDSSCCSAGSSLDSMTRADFHSSDDSLIIDRIRKSFEQKEEFLRRPVVAAVSPRAPPVGGGAAPIQWPAAIPASCVNPPPAQAQQVVSWRTPPVASNAAAALQVAAVTPSRSKHLTRIDEASSGTGCSARLGGGGGLVPVAARAQVFEEGAAGQAGVQLFRSELAGLSEKRSAPDVALRRRQFEAGTAKNQNGGGDERRAAGGGRGGGGGLSRSLDMPCAAMSGNRTTPVGGSRLHCVPPSSSPTPQGLVTSNSSSNIGEAATSWLEEEEWVTTSSSSPPPTTQPRHKAVRQDSYLAACHKPQTQATTESAEASSSAVASAEASAELAVTADSMDEGKGKEKKLKKKKKLKSSSLRSAVRPSRLDLGAKVARPLSCSTPPPQDTKETRSNNLPTKDLQQNSDVDQSHQKTSLLLEKF
ncbi:hypothetical protein LSTR_LSTR012608 [Laodelphax striatellus]|uniref:Uncharacterized protein n=1 Tax=Laodelphax striatellus TaxID=195883 RepID=A0A482XNA3_LAOST|nr:hypothetical protein LSTR_LSTR012608 [Laodelphax striatellus]